MTVKTSIPQTVKKAKITKTVKRGWQKSQKSHKFSKITDPLIKVSIPQTVSWKNRAKITKIAKNDGLQSFIWKRIQFILSSGLIPSLLYAKFGKFNYDSIKALKIIKITKIFDPYRGNKKQIEFGIYQRGDILSKFKEFRQDTQSCLNSKNLDMILGMLCQYIEERNIYINRAISWKVRTHIPI